MRVVEKAPRYVKPINWLLSSLLLGFFVIQGYNLTYLLTREDSFTIIEVIAEKASVKVGEPLPIRVTMKRNRLCMSDIDRFVIRLSNNEVVYRARVIGVSFTVNKTPEMQRVLIPLPVLEPGEYYYRGIIYNNCGSEDFHAVKQPDVTFTVEPP